MLNKNCETTFAFLFIFQEIMSGKNGQSRDSNLLARIRALIVAGLHPDLGETGENLHNLH